MPINKDSLVAVAKERNWVIKTHTIKIPDATHPFGAKKQNFNIEINFKKNVWFGFSFNSDNFSKKSIALSLQKECVSRILKIVQEKDLIHKIDGYASKGTPGELDSYIYFGAVVSFLPNKACNQLKRLFDISRDIQIPN